MDSTGSVWGGNAVRGPLVPELLVTNEPAPQCGSNRCDHCFPRPRIPRFCLPEYRDTSLFRLKTPEVKRIAAQLVNGSGHLINKMTQELRSQFHLSAHHQPREPKPGPPQPCQPYWTPCSWTLVAACGTDTLIVLVYPAVGRL